jgi:3-oxoacyl-[acyl-carrier-protein] synthase III
MSVSLQNFHGHKKKIIRNIFKCCHAPSERFASSVLDRTSNTKSTRSILQLDAFKNSSQFTKPGYS